MRRSLRRRSRLKNWCFAAAALSLPFVALTLAEVALRAWWANPYRPSHRAAGDYSRLQPHPFAMYLNTDGLYAGGGRIRFAVDKHLAVSDGRPLSKPKRVATLGGSTTECMLVPEGQRWPDLLQPRAANYGVSGNTCIDSCHNLRYLLTGDVPRPGRVLLMHAVNDLSAFLRFGPERVRLGAWRQAPFEPFRHEDRALPLGFRLGDSWLVSFVRYHVNCVKGRRACDALLKSHAAQAALPHMPPELLARVVEKLKADFFPSREQTLWAIGHLAHLSSVELVILTQPHAYHPDYTPRRHDLREFPVGDGYLMTVEQSAQVMGMVNDHNRQMASALGCVLIDVAAALAKTDPTPLFFDSVHLTPEGCRRAAKCINKGLRQVRTDSAAVPDLHRDHSRHPSRDSRSLDEDDD